MLHEGTQSKHHQLKQEDVLGFDHESQGCQMYVFSPHVGLFWTFGCQLVKLKYNMQTINAWFITYVQYVCVLWI